MSERKTWLILQGYGVISKSYRDLDGHIYTGYETTFNGKTISDNFWPEEAAWDWAWKKSQQK